MRYSLLILLIGCFLFSCIGCGKREHPANFYYWKTKVSIGDVEKQYFTEMNCRKLYIRFFDVDIQANEVKPVAKITPFDAAALEAEYVPVVFITNRTFSGMTDEGRDRLARNIADLVETMRERNKIPDVKEIQIDCDWTESTRSNYFDFLKKLKAVSKKEISCTLRLHQIKFRRKTGIPPVSKSALMCYATSDPTDDSGRNSILDMKLLKDYTRDINTYPLDFDVALPLYSWAVVTNHLGSVKLINNVTRHDMDFEHFQPLGANEYRVKEDFFFQGIYLNENFTVRVEGVTPELLHEAKDYLDRKITKNYGVIYYHLDKPFLETFSTHDLE
jgi:hypothetical protein